MRSIKAYFLAGCTVYLIFVATICSAQSSGEFTLQIYQGFNFATQNVVNSSAAEDFDVSPRYRGYVAYATLHSPVMIAEYKTKPDLSKSALMNMRGKNLVFGPATGYYYIIKATSTDQYYLLYLKSFENQGKGQGAWRLTFTWEEYIGK